MNLHIPYDQFFSALYCAITMFLKVPDIVPNRVLDGDMLDDVEPILSMEETGVQDATSPQAHDDKDWDEMT